MIVIRYNQNCKFADITIEEVDERLDFPKDMKLIRKCAKSIEEVQEFPDSVFRIHLVRSSVNENGSITSGFTAHKTTKI